MECMNSAQSTSVGLWRIVFSERGGRLEEFALCSFKYIVRFQPSFDNDQRQP